jgi:hypothetical protein
VNSFQNMHTADLRKKLKQVEERSARAETQQEYLDDLFVIQSIIVALKSKGVH